MKASIKTVLDFTMMMEALLDSGLSIRDALEILAVTDRAVTDRSTVSRQSPAAKLARELSTYIAKGGSFAASVRSKTKTFPPIYRGMINLGDRTGSVELIFPRLCSYLKDQKKLKEKISAALAYPIMVFCFSLLGAAALVLFILPKMEGIFGSFGGSSAEQIHRNIQNAKNWGLFLTLFLAFFLIAILTLKLMSRKNKKLECFMDSTLLKIPMLGGFLILWESLNFSFAMEILTGGGLPVDAALGESTGVISNRFYRQSLFRAREGVVNGGTLSSAFARDPIFPPYLSRWAAIGEQSGGPEKVFSQIRTYFQAEVEQRTEKFLLLIEPAMIIITGIFVLILITGIILPLFSAYGNVL
jgi:type II secretory pathway component PulF